MSRSPARVTTDHLEEQRKKLGEWFSGVVTRIRSKAISEYGITEDEADEVVNGAINEFARRNWRG